MPRSQPGTTVDCHDCGESTVQLERSDCQGHLRQSTFATVDSNCQTELSDGCTSRDRCWSQALPAIVRLQVCPLLERGGYALPDRFLTTQISSSAACVLHGLDDVASTPLSEFTSSLHDDGLSFDRGK